MYDKNNQSFNLKKKGDVFALEKEVASHNKRKPDYEQVIESSKFKALMKEKKKFTIPLTIFFLVFYFMLPILTSYSTILNTRSEEHTSELQSRGHLVCRLLLEQTNAIHNI